MRRMFCRSRSPEASPPWQRLQHGSSAGPGAVQPGMVHFAHDIRMVRGRGLDQPMTVTTGLFMSSFSLAETVSSARAALCSRPRCPPTAAAVTLAVGPDCTDCNAAECLIDLDVRTCRQKSETISRPSRARTGSTAGFATAGLSWVRPRGPAASSAGNCRMASGNEQRRMCAHYGPHLFSYRGSFAAASKLTIDSIWA